MSLIKKFNRSENGSDIAGLIKWFDSKAGKTNSRSQCTAVNKTAAGMVGIDHVSRLIDSFEKKAEENRVSHAMQNGRPAERIGSKAHGRATTKFCGGDNGIFGPWKVKNVDRFTGKFF